MFLGLDLYSFFRVQIGCPIIERQVQNLLNILTEDTGPTVGKLAIVDRDLSYIQ